MNLSIESKKNIWKDRLGSFAFVVPALVIFSIFWIYPFYEIISLSFHEWNGIDSTKDFVGTQNYKTLFDFELTQSQIWWKSLVNAGYITLFALVFQNALAFALALACDHQIKFKNTYRVIFFLPPVLSEIVVGMIWGWILQGGKQGGEYIGVFNYFLDKIGLDHLIQSWLAEPETALTAIAIVHCWKGFGWGFLILLAGLQTIDRQLYEAAKIDGAGWWRSFWNVTIPMMMPVIVVVMILTILGSMQAFVVIIGLVGSGLPDGATTVPVLEILMSMTNRTSFGLACAQGIIFALILITISFAFKWISDRVKQE